MDGRCTSFSLFFGWEGKNILKLTVSPRAKTHKLMTTLWFKVQSHITMIPNMPPTPCCFYYRTRRGSEFLEPLSQRNMISKHFFLFIPEFLLHIPVKGCLKYWPVVSWFHKRLLDERENQRHIDCPSNWYRRITCPRIACIPPKN